MCRHNYYLYDDVENKIIPLLQLFEIVTPTLGGPVRMVPYVSQKSLLGHRAKFCLDQLTNVAVLKTMHRQTDTLIYISDHRLN